MKVNNTWKHDVCNLVPCCMCTDEGSYLFLCENLPCHMVVSSENWSEWELMVSRLLLQPASWAYRKASE